MLNLSIICYIKGTDIEEEEEEEEEDEEDEEDEDFCVGSVGPASDDSLFGHLIGCDTASRDAPIREVFWFHKAEAYKLLNLKVF